MPASHCVYKLLTHISLWISDPALALQSPLHSLIRGLFFSKELFGLLA